MNHVVHKAPVRQVERRKMGSKNIGGRENRSSHVWAAKSMGVLADGGRRMRSGIDGQQQGDELDCGFLTTTAAFYPPYVDQTKHRPLGRRHLRSRLVVTQQTALLGAKQFNGAPAPNLASIVTPLIG